MENKPFKLQDKADAQPFQVPEGFFDDFQTSLARRIDEIEAVGQQAKMAEVQTEASKTERPVVDITWRQRVKPYLYFAAMFVMMFFTIKGIIGQREVQQQNLAMQELEVEEVSTDQITAEDILMSELDSYNLMYYLYGEE